MFAKVLIANRGEIAVRVARTCRELGIATVAVHSTADRDSAVVALADEAVQIGPPAARRSYLNVAAIVEAALRTGADAVHPGYGFLSEDPDFAEVCAEEGLTFIGPPPHVMTQVGDKSTARRLMSEAGLPLLPGTLDPVPTAAEGAAIAGEIGYPVIIKAVAGGGGRGMAVVHEPAQFEEAFEATRHHAKAVFGSGALYVERYLAGARHVEVQVLCDTHGNGVHLGERDCSIQRRHQKLIEESPCARMDDDARARLGDLAVQGALAIGFTGAGTMEFLLAPDGDVHFMELNARIQVEHPVTELRTGIDLVREQILVAAGEPLGFTQDDVVSHGVAIECRVNAEDPAREFAPTPGRLDVFRPPAGPFTRVDTGYREGDRVPPEYDSLIAKVIVWAPDRASALARMDRALAEFAVSGGGMSTTVGLHRTLLRDPVFTADEHTSQYLDAALPQLLDPRPLPSPTPLRTIGGPVMTGIFTISDLLHLLTTTSGLAPDSHTDDPTATLEDVGLDSLAFLALQTELQDRYGFELPDDRSPLEYPLGEMAGDIDARLRELPLAAEAS